MQVRKIQGVTLLEIMLVLVIASTVIIMGLRAYMGYKKDNDFRVVENNVNTVFQAMGQYVRANCAGPNGALFPNLTATPKVDPNVIVGITPVTLVTKGFLAKWPLQFSALVDNSDATSYILQFNPTLSSTMNVVSCDSQTDSSTCTTTPMPLTANVQSLIWNAQVAIKIRSTDEATIKAAAARLGADCISTLAGTTPETIQKCTPTPLPFPASGPAYLVFERLPSFAAPTINSPLSQSMPLVKQFNMQYTHDPMYEFNLGNSTASGTQYYVCGG